MIKCQPTTKALWQCGLTAVTSAVSHSYSSVVGLTVLYPPPVFCYAPSPGGCISVNSNFSLLLSSAPGRRNTNSHTATMLNVVRHTMRLYIAIVMLSLTLVFGCNSPDKKTIDTFIETQPSFYDLRNGDPTKNSWIRNPENLIMVHETFKKIGYRNLIDNYLMTENPFIAQGVYINRPLRQILDSLEITYKLDTIQEKYYREFWLRRKAENNDSIVFVIVKEVNASFTNMIAPAFNNDLVNDTLYNLAFIEYRADTLNSTIATDNFFRLRTFGFHQSAYNILYETNKYENVTWNRDSLKSTLTKSDNFIFPWFQDDTK